MDGLSIVQLIEEELKKQGISKGKFYKESGISSATFSQWRTGIYSPSSEALRKVEKYLGITFTIGQKEKPAISEDDRLNAEFIELFSKLSDAEKTMMLSQLKELVSGR